MPWKRRERVYSLKYQTLARSSFEFSSSYIRFVQPIVRSDVWHRHFSPCCLHKSAHIRASNIEAVLCRVVAQNPELLDGPKGPEYSSQIAAMQEARLALPPPSDASGSNALTPAEPKYGLLPSQGATKRVPHGELFPMRPPETGPGDQLMLNAIDPEEQLDMAQIFEIFARHKEDPEYWTVPRLADEYFTSENTRIVRVASFAACDRRSRCGTAVMGML